MNYLDPKLEAEDILSYFEAIAPYIKKIIPHDIGIAIIKNDTYQYYKPADTLNFNVKPGDKIKKDVLADLAMRNKKKMLCRYTIENSKFDIPYIASALPIIGKNEEAIGCIVITESRNLEEIIRNSSNELNAASKELAFKLQEIRNQFEHFNILEQELHSVSENTIKKVDDTNRIIDFIKIISNKTNILGINALIEAARVGETGKGFEVVASEIRKLSYQSAKSVKEIEEIINQIKELNRIVESKVKDVNDFTEGYLGIVQEIAATSEELMAMGEGLSNVVNELWKD